MPTTDFAMTLEDAKRLYEEKLESLRGQVGALERELGRHQIEVDNRREEIARLEKEIGDKRTRLDQLSNKVASGEAALEDSRVRIGKTLDEREEKANKRVEVAEGAEAKLQTERQRVAQAQSRVDGLKSDLLKAAATLVTEAQKVKTSVEHALS